VASYAVEGSVCSTSESVIKTLESVKRGCVEENKFLKMSASNFRCGTLFGLLSHHLFSASTPFAPVKVWQQSSEDCNI